MHYDVSAYGIKKSETIRIVIRLIGGTDEPGTSQEKECPKSEETLVEMRANVKKNRIENPTLNLNILHGQDRRRLVW